MTPSGIEPATFRFVAHCLKLRYRLNLGGRETKNTVSAAITRQSRSCETSLYIKQRNENRVRSENIWSLVQTHIFAPVAQIIQQPKHVCEKFA